MSTRLPTYFISPGGGPWPYLDGPFRHMKSNWAFAPAEGGCEVSFFVDFEFRNAILQGIIGVVFNEAMQRIVRAFERRAAALYG